MGRDGHWMTNRTEGPATREVSQHERAASCDAHTHGSMRISTSAHVAVRVKKIEPFGRLHVSSTRSHRRIRAHLAGDDAGMLRGRPPRLQKTRAAQTTLDRTTEQVLRNATRSTRELLWPKKLAIGKGKAAHMLTAEHHAVAEHGR